MALVQFVFQSKSIRITKPYVVPKKVTDVYAWFKNARKCIPDIPLPGSDTGWFHFNHLADPSFVVFELRNDIGEKCAVVIDRTASKW